MTRRIACPCPIVSVLHLRFRIGGENSTWRRWLDCYRGSGGGFDLRRGTYRFRRWNRPALYDRTQSREVVLSGLVAGFYGLPIELQRAARIFCRRPTHLVHAAEIVKTPIVTLCCRLLEIFKGAQKA